MTAEKTLLIANRYSNALVQLAKESTVSFEKISEDLSTVKNAIEASSELRTSLTSPRVTIETKKAILSDIFTNKINRLILNFLDVLVEKGRFSAFDEIVNCYSRELDKINNLERITVTSAVELKPEQKERIENKLSEKLGKAVLINWLISCDIIAGLLVQIGDRVIDTGIKHKLEDLTKNIMRI